MQCGYTEQRTATFTKIYVKTLKSRDFMSCSFLTTSIELQTKENGINFSLLVSRQLKAKVMSRHFTRKKNASTDFKMCKNTQ